MSSTASVPKIDQERCCIVYKTYDVDLHISETSGIVRFWFSRSEQIHLLRTRVIALENCEFQSPTNFEFITTNLVKE